MYQKRIGLVKKIRQKLKSNKPTIGTWMQIPSTDIAEILANSGYDWIAVDLEHGNFSKEKIPEIFRAIESGGAVPFARIATTEKKEIKHALEAGAKGIIFPMIETKEQLEESILNTFYPPKGIRGVGYSRANIFGKKFDNYINDIANEVIVVAQIEHIKAVGNLEEILSVDYLDALMIGPYDLSGSMNITGDFENPEFIKIIKTISDKASKLKIPMGFHVVKPDKTLLEDKISDGYQFIAYCTDAIFLYSTSENPIN